MKYEELIFNKPQAHVSLRSSKIISSLSKLGNGSGILPNEIQVLGILEAIPDYIRGILLRIAAHNFPDGEIKILPGMNEGIFYDYLNLLKDLQMIEDDRFLIEPYMGAVRSGPLTLEKIVSKSQAGKICNIKKHQIMLDKLSQKIFGDEEATHKAEDINQDTLYLLYLVRYLKELSNMSFYKRVKSTLPEGFYSDLGDIAFRLYTKDRFYNLCEELPYASFLDIGCGEGRHIEVAHRVRPSAEIIGIDLQEDLIKSTAQRFEGNNNISVLNKDFFDWNPVKSFDVVFACYMIFYMPLEKRVEFFTKVKDVLTDGGKFVLCQYFPDVAEIQYQLIKNDSKYITIFKEHLARIGISICLAETLLNHILDAFQSVAYWNELVEQLEEAGLVIEEIRPAESLYYSFIVVIGKKCK